MEQVKLMDITEFTYNEATKKMDAHFRELVLRALSNNIVTDKGATDLLRETGCL